MHTLLSGPAPRNPSRHVRWRRIWCSHSVSSHGASDAAYLSPLCHIRSNFALSISRQKELSFNNQRKHLTSIDEYLIISGHLIAKSLNFSISIHYKFLSSHDVQTLIRKWHYVFEMCIVDLKTFNENECFVEIVCLRLTIDQCIIFLILYKIEQMPKTTSFPKGKCAHDKRSFFW